MSEFMNESVNSIDDLIKGSITRSKINESVQRQELDSFRESENERLYLKEQRNLKRANFIENLHKTLLKESIGSIYYKVLDPVTVRNNRALMESIVESYINENGFMNIISSMKLKSNLLSEMALNIETTFDKILEGINPDDETTFDVDTVDKTEFFDNISKMEDVDDAINLIRMRVSNAEEEFATDNMEDKFNTNNIMKQTADRIESLRKDEYSQEDKDYNTSLEQEAASYTKAAINQLNNRRKNVLEFMVRKLANDSVKNGIFVESVSGKLDVESLIESTKCIYAFIETVNTIKLEDIDTNYLEKYLNNF